MSVCRPRCRLERSFLGFDVDSDYYFRLSRFFKHPSSGRGARLAVAVSPLELQLAPHPHPPRLRQAARIRSAAPTLARSFRARLSRQLSARNVDSRSLCPQAHKTSMYLLPSFLIRTQSWQTGRCDITDDTQPEHTPHSAATSFKCRVAFLAHIPQAREILLRLSRFIF